MVLQTLALVSCLFNELITLLLTSFLLIISLLITLLLITCLPKKSSSSIHLMVNHPWLKFSSLKRSVQLFPQMLHKCPCLTDRSSASSRVSRYYLYVTPVYLYATYLRIRQRVFNLQTFLFNRCVLPNGFAKPNYGKAKLPIKIGFCYTQ